MCYQEACVGCTTMSREVRVSDDDGSSVVTMLIERGWLAFIILGIFIVGLRLFNVSQRAQQRKLLREGLMAEMGYYNKVSRKNI